MGHRVPRVVAHVEYQAVPLVGHPGCMGDLGGQLEHLGQKRAVIRTEIAGIGDVLSGNDEHMGGSHGRDIPESDRQVAGGHLIARDLTLDDAAEDAVVHRGKLAPDPLAARFLADARTAESARSRSREHWLRRQAEESATFAGTIRALAERGAEVEVSLGGSSVISGRLTAAGRDLIEVDGASGPTWVAVSRIETLTSPGATVASDDRELEGGRSMAGLLAGLAADRAEVEILVGGRWLIARLAGAGSDIVTLRTGTEMEFVAVGVVAAARLAQSPGSG